MLYAHKGSGMLRRFIKIAAKYFLKGIVEYCRNHFREGERPEHKIKEKGWLIMLKFKTNRVLAVMIMLVITLMVPLLPLSESQAATSVYNTVTVKTLAPGTALATPAYIIKSNVPGPRVLITGGVHGNETAGFKAAHILRTYRITKGTLIVIPETNKPAVKAGIRYLRKYGDLNRAFPAASTSTVSGPLSPLVKSILSLAKTYDIKWHLDLHEGYDFASNPKTDSVGQSIIYHPNNNGYTVAKNIRDTLNKGITTSYKKFRVLKWPVQGSVARSIGNIRNANSFIIETAQKQTLTTRVNQQTKAVRYVLNNVLHMLPAAGQTIPVR